MGCRLVGFIGVVISLLCSMRTATARRRLKVSGGRAADSRAKKGTKRQSSGHLANRQFVAEYAPQRGPSASKRKSRSKHSPRTMTKQYHSASAMVPSMPLTFAGLHHEPRQASVRSLHSGNVFLRGKSTKKESSSSKKQEGRNPRPGEGGSQEADTDAPLTVVSSSIAVQFPSVNVVPSQEDIDVVTALLCNHVETSAGEMLASGAPLLYSHSVHCDLAAVPVSPQRPNIVAYRITAEFSQQSAFIPASEAIAALACTTLNDDHNDPLLHNFDRLSRTSSPFYGVTEMQCESTAGNSPSVSPPSANSAAPITMNPTVGPTTTRPSLSPTPLPGTLVPASVSITFPNAKDITNSDIGNIARLACNHLEATTAELLATGRPLVQASDVSCTLADLELDGTGLKLLFDFPVRFSENSRLIPDADGVSDLICLGLEDSNLETFLRDVGSLPGDISLLDTGSTKCIGAGSQPSRTPTVSPTVRPTPLPTVPPTTMSPTESPSSRSPTQTPTIQPTTFSPTQLPSSRSPTQTPTTRNPTDAPISRSPTQTPTSKPTSRSPTSVPTRSKPTTLSPTSFPTQSPTKTPTAPTTEPSTAEPTLLAFDATKDPTASPVLSGLQTNQPTTNPSAETKTTSPTHVPSPSPVGNVTSNPAVTPSISPTAGADPPSSFRPTAGFPIAASPFSIEYIAPTNNVPTADEFAAAADITCQHLVAATDSIFLSTNSFVSVDQVQCQSTSTSADPTLTIQYQLVIVFSETSILVPTQTDIDIMMATFFQDPLATDLEASLSTLPSSSFASTTGVVYSVQ